MSRVFRLLFLLEANSAPSFCLLVELLTSYTLGKKKKSIEYDSEKHMPVLAALRSTTIDVRRSVKLA